MAAALLCFPPPCPAQPPELPPGVTIADPIPATAKTPLGVAIFALRVDWTSARLSARLESGMPPAAGLPLPWDRLAGGDAAALKIQLSEPRRAERGWELALDAEMPAAAPPGATLRAIEIDPPLRPTAPDAPFNQVRVGGIAPWFYAGPDRESAAEPLCPLGEGSSRVEVRWLGRAADWARRPPRIERTDRWLLSVLDPLTGRGFFLLVLNQSGRPLEATHLTVWLQAAFGPQEWIALHSIGSHARIGAGDWRLGPEPTSSPALRGGAVLVLERLRAGRTIDWARVGRPRLKVSSAERGYPAAAMLNGRLWPVPLAPSVWTSRVRDGRESGREWIELEFERPVPVMTIRLVWAEAAGWSEHFNPEEARLIVREAGTQRDAAPIVLTNPIRAYSTVVFPSPIRVARLRLEYTRAGRFGLPAAARLMGLQVLGTWSAEP